MIKINVLFGITHHHMLISLMVFDHVSAIENDATYMLYSDDEMETWGALGLLKNPSWISLQNLREVIEKNADIEVNFIFHHYEFSFRNLINKLIINGVLNLDFSLKFSYYADGYTNYFIRFDYHKCLESMGVSKSYSHYKAYTFDVENTYEFNSSMGVVSEVIKSDFMRNSITNYGLGSIVKSVFDSIPRGYDNYVLIALRPWGSDSFHNGEYYLSNGGDDLYRIVKDAVARMSDWLAGSVLFLIRGTSRDSLVISKFYEALSNNNIDADYIILDHVYPDWIPLDPFIFNFSQEINRPLNTYAFDSTTALPSVALGVNELHYFGVNESFLKYDIAPSENFIRKILAHIKNLEQHVISLSKNKFELVRLDKTSFLVKN